MSTMIKNTTSSTLNTSSTLSTSSTSKTVNAFLKTY